MSSVASIILAIVVLAIVVAVAVYLMNWLYRRSSKEVAFVRTGFGGQKVIMNGGAFVLPIIHDIIPVNMNTLRLEVQRGRDKALITRNRMRVDVISEFYVRVQSSPDAIANAAQTLGQRTMQPEALRELLEGKFVDALRSVDAEGLTQLTEQIERRKKLRNDIEQDTMIQIRNKNLEAEKQSLDIDQESEAARLAQERELEVRRSSQRADIARERAQHDPQAEQAQIVARLEVERSRITTERTLQEARIRQEQELQQLEVERRKTLELAEQARAVAIAQASKAQSDAQAEAEIARAKAVSAEEKVFSARETEIAQRRKAIDLIGAAQDAERDAIRVKVAAEADKSAASDRSDARRIDAEGEAEADKIRSLAARLRYEIEAEVTRLMNEAQNALTPESRASAMRLRLLDRLEAIIRESVKPMEKIEGIKILHVDGLGGGTSREAGSEGGANLADSVVNSALRYRAQAPLIDSLLKEIGLSGGGDLGKLDNLMREPVSSDETLK